MTYAHPMPIVYAGLFGVIVALLIATAQNKWSLRVFFLLALRIAIGWQFFFEGMHKINSHRIGPSETNKPFTSEPYFKASPTSLGERMRKKFDDPQEVFAARVIVAGDVKPDVFAKLSRSEQAAACPE